MHHETYFHNCSEDYIHSIDSELYGQIINVIACLSKRAKQTSVNNDLFWLLTDRGWSYDTLAGVSELPPKELGVSKTISDLKRNNNRSLCETTKTFNADWHTDFAKSFGDKLVHLEAQFGKVEAMFKDFCGFRIARYENRLALGIEIVICKPSQYFSHRKGAVSGMAYFEIAKNTLPTIGLDCPIWLIGIYE